VKFLLLGLAAVGVVLIYVKNFHAEELQNLQSQRLSDLVGGVGGGRRVPHQSHPGEVPKFLGKGQKGNFEPEVYGGGAGPGDNGRAHKLRVEQKGEEERLKGSVCV
jgi:hypothetical protein